MATNELESLKRMVDEADVILLDIEGTITSIDFVKNELFPYAEAHLEDFIRQHWADEEVRDAITILKAEAALDSDENGFVPILECSDYGNDEIREEYLMSIVSNLKWQMSLNRKTTGLKKIQGLIWRIGYENEILRGNFYRDFIQALDNWKAQEKVICIYSSGSREAQLYLFKYSHYGDLTPFVQEFFDTTIGSKLEPESYANICKEIGHIPEDIVFFTDRPKEIFAARKCGLKTVLVIRDPEHPLIEEEKEYLGHENGRINNLNLWKFSLTEQLGVKNSEEMEMLIKK